MVEDVDLLRLAVEAYLGALAHLEDVPRRFGWGSARRAAKRSVITAQSTLEMALRRVQPDRRTLPGEPLSVGYTNYKGEWLMRRIRPRSVRYGSTEWHPEPQWLLLAFDLDKNAEREFALKDFGPRRSAEMGAVT